MSRTKCHQRFEAKYLISEREALAIRNYIEPYTSPDPLSYPTRTYVVSSLYVVELKNFIQDRRAFLFSNPEIN